MRLAEITFKAGILSLITQTVLTIGTKPCFASGCSDAIIKERLLRKAKMVGIKATPKEIKGVIENYRLCCEDDSPETLSYTFSDNQSRTVNCSALDLKPASTQQGALPKGSNHQACLPKKGDLNDVTATIKNLEKTVKCADLKAEKPEQLLGWHLMSKIEKKDSTFIANALKKDTWEKENEELLKILNPKADKKLSEIKTSLLELEMIGVTPDQIKASITNLNSKNLEALQKLLSSPSLKNSSMMKVVKSFIQLRSSQAKSPFHLQFQDLVGDMSGMKISNWKPKAQRGLANVLTRAHQILGKNPKKTMKKAYEEAAKEYGIWNKTQTCSI